jgi:hypothetical protein
MRAYFRPAAVLLAGALVLPTACNKGGAIPDKVAPAPAAKSVGPPVTEAEAKEFAEKLTQALKAGDRLQVDALLHLPDLLERLVMDLKLAPEEHQAFVRAARSRFGVGALARQILAATGDGGSYTVLRVHTVGGQPRVLFRALSADGSFNYHDYRLARFADGVGMADIHVFLSGELVSQEIRRLVIPAVANSLQGRQVKGLADQDVRTGQMLNTMVRAVREGDFAKAAADYRQLPAKFQEDQAVLITYIHALGRQGEPAEKDYLAAIEKFRRHYPENPAVDVISVNYYFLKKQYGKALATLQRLDVAVGGDPYLDALRAEALTEAQHYDQARAAAERAVKAEPRLLRAYEARLLLTLRERKYAETVQWLKRLVETCGVELTDLPANPEFAEFVRSPQYREWLDWYQTRGKKP